MPDEPEERIARALRAEVADLPMAITPSMVEDRIHRTAGYGLSLPVVGGAMAAALVLVVAASSGWPAGRQPAGAPQPMQPMIVRSDEPIAPPDAEGPAVCLLVRLDASGRLSAWWYSPGAAACTTTSSSLVAIDDDIASSAEDADAYPLRFSVQVTTGDLEFVALAATVHFPATDAPYFSGPRGPVTATLLDRAAVPPDVGWAETPVPTPMTATPPPASVKPGISACPTTQPGRAPADIGAQLFGSGSAHGNDALWVGGLGEDGVIDARPAFVADDGSVGWKLGWWRDVRGTLEISGRRLDADAPPLGARVPEGYGSIGFQASGVSFPTEGCWLVTGRIADAELSFVTYVIDLQAEVDGLFADAQVCEAALAGVELDVTFPATWSAGEASGGQAGCTRFAADVDGPLTSGQDGAAIPFGAVGGPEGPRLPEEEELSRQHRRVADMQAMRVEIVDSETDVKRLTYWIEAGTDPEVGPTIVATTSSDGAGNYVLNKAVLDRMMEELATGN